MAEKLVMDWDETSGEFYMCEEVICNDIDSELYGEIGLRYIRKATDEEVHDYLMNLEVEGEVKQCQ